MEDTVLVANVVVEVDLGVAELTALGAEAGSEDVVVCDVDVLGGKVERHDWLCVGGGCYEVGVL